MPAIHATFGIIAGLLAICAYIPYVRSILKDETKPNRASFLIWSVVDIVLISSYIASGARTTIWTALVYCIFQLGVLGLSFRYGVGGLGKLDIVCLLGAFAGIIAWVVTDNAHTALFLSIACEILGFLPTVKKAYSQPETESKLAWSISICASTCNLLAINAFTLTIVIYPVYNFIFVGIVAGLLITRQGSQRTVHNTDPLR